MWPPHSQVLDQTLAAEAAVEDLYAEALLRWAPTAMAAALPSLNLALVSAADDELPPDPEAVAATQSTWDELLAATVLPGVAAIWTGAAAAAAASDAVTETAVNVAEALTGALADFLTGYAAVAAKVPLIIRDELATVLRRAAPGTARSALRAMVREAVTPGSGMLRGVSRRLGYHGASILNDALLSTATRFGGAERKRWVATLDDRTRDTHWVADGQVVPIEAMFTVGGVNMAFPGDPTAPIRELVNCRCRLQVLAAGEEPKLRHVPKAEAKKRADRGVVHSGDNAQEPIAAATEEDDMTTAVTDLPPEAQTETYRTFTDAVVAFIGTPTSDYRLLHNDIKLSFRSTPLPLMWMQNTGDGGGHDHAYTVGVIESARVSDDRSRVLASGYMLNTAEADMAVEQLKHKVTRPSVDLSSVEWQLTDESGKELTEADFYELPFNAKVLHTFTAAELIGTTLVSTPAFGDTMLALAEAREARDPALAAAVATLAPPTFPAELFDDPHLSQATRPTVDVETGRVYGHLAEFGHPYRGGSGEAVPRNHNGYANFHTSQVMLDNGKQLAVGRLTVKGGHASTDPRVTAATAREHYDNACTTFALVRVGEDAHGIWFSGVPAPGVDREVFEQGITCPLSGDWRDCGTGLDMIAAHAVNSPGFPIYSGSTGPDGREVALVAALGPPPTRNGISRDDITAAVKAALTEVNAEQRLTAERDAALAAAAALPAPKSPNDQVADLLARSGL